jgi:hypothetical protein
MRLQEDRAEHMNKSADTPEDMSTLPDWIKKEAAAEGAHDHKNCGHTH